MCPPSAFNNILSNLGYILLGLLFLLIILQREINHNRALLRNDLYALVGACGLAAPPALPTPRCPQPAPLRSSLLQVPSCLTSSLLPSPDQECGIPKHFGLFYAMGTALMMEGLLSACYHVCPNYTNFQFGEWGWTQSGDLPVSPLSPSPWVPGRSSCRGTVWRPFLGLRPSFRTWTSLQCDP